MADECELTRASAVHIDLLGATLVVSATEVSVPAGWIARVDLIEEGDPTLLRLVACPAKADRGDSAVDIEVNIALPSAPALVLLETADGHERFEFAVARELEIGGTVRGGGGEAAVAGGAEASNEPAGGPIGEGDIRYIDSPAGGYAMGSGGDDDSAGGGGGDEGGGAVRGRSGDEAEGFSESAAPVESEEEAIGSAVSHEPIAEPSAGFYPSIQSREKFVVGVAQDITVGVSATLSEKVAGSGMEIPETAGDEFILTVQIVADGFALADKEGAEEGDPSWRHDLAVTRNQPYPKVVVELVADPIKGEIEIRRIRVLYSIGGQVIGVGERSVAVVATAAVVAAAPAPGLAARTAMAVPVSKEPADLTVVILHDPEVDGRLLWAFSTPHEAVSVPATDFTTDIGGSPEAFSQRLRTQVETAEATEGQPLLRQTLKGIGRTITQQMPTQMWEILRSVAEQRADSPPTVLILSQEPYVPWELAVMEHPLDESTPPFFGAQAVTGRWIFGQDKLKWPPPEVVAMDKLAVVYGIYEHARLAALPEALEEKTKLETDYAALPVRATLSAVSQLLAGAPPANVLHFAIHGRFQEAAGAGLLMEDGAPFPSWAVSGTDLTASPLVFLGACQVGAGEAVLGDYSGMAEAFLQAGASAVVAPLWSVRDSVAKDIALRFYPGALDDHLTPAELLRRERANFGGEGQPLTATHLAYLFYGHPTFRLTRATT